MYNLKDSQRRQKQQEVIDKFKDQQKRAEKEEIFNDEREEDDGMFGTTDQMRQTQNGFRKSWKPEDDMGGMDDEDSDEEEGVDDDERQRPLNFPRALVRELFEPLVDHREEQHPELEELREPVQQLAALALERELVVGVVL